jgi:anti-sigma regulatory factor (Ser/Thr protein kinase)
MTPDAPPLTRPVAGSAWLSGAHQPRPHNAGSLALAAMPTAPFWARRYTRRFLGSCRGITDEAADTAELLVSELVTNAVRFSGDPARALTYSERASARLIALSLRHFGVGLLIEVFDTDNDPPVLVHARDDAENGRGLMLVDALCREWSYFHPAEGGKVVYCFLETS